MCVIAVIFLPPLLCRLLIVAYSHGKSVFIPVVNPDGLVWTWEVDRMWRKNRRDNGGSFGVDLNRNFDANVEYVFFLFLSFSVACVDWLT